MALEAHSVLPTNRFVSGEMTLILSLSLFRFLRLYLSVSLLLPPPFSLCSFLHISYCISFRWEHYLVLA